MKEMIIRLPEEGLGDLLGLVKSKGWEAFETELEDIDALKEAQRRLVNNDKSKNVAWDVVRTEIREQYGI
ncbi:MAG: hypothetical protein Kapaf2KO_20930 [Candidatus Kapaibacteriales bacterium]